MTTTKIKASKLQNAEVTHISLVDRGANRIPFKIIKEDKQEKSMFNLSTIFKSDGKKVEAKKEETLKISAIAIKKSDATDDIMAVLKAEGFNVDLAIDQDDSIIYKQEEFDLAVNYFNEDNWLILVSEFDTIVKVELGCIIVNDEFDWKF